jgi:hypothetical protein
VFSLYIISFRIFEFFYAILCNLVLVDVGTCNIQISNSPTIYVSMLLFENTPCSSKLSMNRGQANRDVIVMGV